MKKKLKWLFMAWIVLTSESTLYAQELFTYTEPASNMAAKSIGLRMNNTFMVDESSKKINWHVLPELMFGLTRNWMVHAEAFLSNRNGRFTTEGGSLYVKYRLFSADDVHAHTRIALYGLYAKNNSDVHQDAIDLRGHNTGSELGAVFSQLIHKVAFSGSFAWIRGTDNRSKEGYKLPSIQRDALAYTTSIGKLMLPKEYISYDQVNLNLMMEALGQTNLHSGKSFVDLAPVVQLIIQSRMRIDLGYRFPLVNDLSRTATRGVMLRLEYNWFNAY